MNREEKAFKRMFGDKPERVFPKDIPCRSILLTGPKFSAKERLAKVWFHLGGIAGPGQLKPQSARAPRRAYTQTPLPAGWESTPDASKTEQPAPTPAQLGSTPKESS